MPKNIVSDSSCLILFYKIGEFNLLKEVFGQLFITETVSEEFNKPLPDWVKVSSPDSNFHKEILSIVDLGEATSISLALESESVLLIIDDLKGRRLAKQMGISITGSLGVLVMAKRKGYIKSVKPIIKAIEQTNFRISDKLINKVLESVDES